MLNSQSRSRSRGLSLIEALVSIVIMLVVLLGLLGVIPYGYGKIQVNATQVQAVALGQQYLDTMRNNTQSKIALPTATTAAIDQGRSFMNGATNPSAGSFNITPNTCPLVSGTTNEYDCEVAVTWKENGQSQSITVESYVTL